MEKYGEIPKKFTKEWWDHIWYYYKWRFIAGIIVGIMAIVTIYQIATQVDYDTIITYLGVVEFDYDYTRLNVENDIKQYANDVNGNGKVEVQFDILTNKKTSLGEYDPQQVMANELKKTVGLQKGDGYIYIFNEEELAKLYSTLLSQDTFIPLDDWLENKELPRAEGEAGECFVKIEKSTYLESFDFFTTEPMYFGIRRIRADEDTEMAPKRLEDAKVIANYIINKG